MPRLTCVTRLWTVDHMRCSPPVRPAALKHGIGTRGGLRSHAAPFRPRERSPRRPPYSTARWPVEQHGGRLDRMGWADSTACRPIRPDAVGRPDRSGSADPADRVPTGPAGVCRSGRCRSLPPEATADSAGQGPAPHGRLRPRATTSGTGPRRAQIRGQLDRE